MLPYNGILGTVFGFAKSAKEKAPQIGDQASEHVVNGILALRDAYKARAANHRRWFRVSGILIIVLSATLPLLAGADFDGKNVVIGVIGVAVAVVAGLRNFYKWDHLWGVLRRSAFELDFLLAQWRLDVANIACDRKQKAAKMEAIRKRTADLAAAANEVRERESSGYFTSLSFPGAEKKEGS
jgi:hypothetical protein